MRKGITPVISVVLLVLMTVGASVLAFVWINSVQSSVQESAGGSVAQAPGSSCSRLNVISMRGDGITVSNVGCDTISNVSLVIDGVLTSYDLGNPLAPGQAAVISYDSLSDDEDHCVSVVLSTGQTVQQCSDADQNVLESGYGETNETSGEVFYAACGNGTVVDWDNKVTFDLGDTLSCGCNTTTSNIISNPGFESDFTGWRIVEASRTIIINDTHPNTGSKCAYLATNPGDGPSVQPYLQENASTLGYFKISVNGSVGGAGSFSGVIAKFGEGSETKQIYYLFFQNGYSSYCDALHPAVPDSAYIACITGLTDYEWNDVILYPESDFLAIFGDILDEYPANRFDLMVNGNDARILFDDILVGPSSEGEYCDSDNLGGNADGVCYYGGCIDPYIGPFTNDNEYLYTSTIPVSMSFTSFSGSPTCNLNIDGSDYAMTLTSTASRTVGPLSSGEYTANVSCTGNDYISRTMNITTLPMILNWSTTFDFTKLGNTIGDSGYVALAEFDASNPGLEIFVSAVNETLVLSNTGVVIRNISAIAGDIEWDDDVNYWVNFGPPKIADVNFDSYNELVLRTGKNLYVFDKDYNLIGNFTLSGDISGYNLLPTIADINSSHTGLEVLRNNGPNTIDAYNYTGGLLWSYTVPGPDGPGGSSLTYSTTVAADINPGNQGLEIVFSESKYTTGLYMIAQNGTHLTNYSVFATSSNIRPVSPAVGEVESTSSGLEVAAVLTRDFSNRTLYLFDSNLNPLWSYNLSANYYYWTPLIGDLTGDGDKEIVVYSELIGAYPQSALVFDKSGNLILNISSYQGEYFEDVEYIMLSELDNSNSGVEMFGASRDGFKLVDVNGNILYHYSNVEWTGLANPTIYQASADVDGDGKLEVVGVSGWTNLTVYYFETESTSTSLGWSMFGHDLNNTYSLP